MRSLDLLGDFSGRLDSGGISSGLCFSPSLSPTSSCDFWFCFQSNYWATKPGDIVRFCAWFTPLGVESSGHQDIQLLK